MATLSLSNAEVYANLATLMGIARDSANWSTQTEDDVERIVRMGRRKLFAAHDWSFLEQRITLRTVVPITTGTVTIVAGVCTFTSAIVPTDAINYVLVPVDSDGEVTGVYPIGAYTDTTHCTLEDTSVNAAALTTFTLYKYRIALASNFGGWLDPITFDNNTEIQELGTLPEWITRGFAGRNVVKTGRPQVFSVTQIVSEETGIPAYYLTMYPLPEQVYIMHARMRVQPGDALTEVADVCPAMFAEIMMAAILSAAEIMYHDEQGVHTANYERLLPDFIRKDRLMRGTRNVRPLDYKVLPPNYQAMIAPITYE
jgi:hypothetical protein